MKVALNATPTTVEAARLCAQDRVEWREIVKEQMLTKIK